MSSKKYLKFILLNFCIIQSIIHTIALTSLNANAEEPTANWDNLSSADVPTVIVSDSMVLKNKEQKFTYTGNVVLEKGDLKMLSKRLEGKYNDDQGIDELTAYEDVVITKGVNIRARSNKAVYEKSTETMVLTENPEVIQDQSILTADLVRIFLNENRSTAEGNVRVKLIETHGQQ